ncbi:RNA 2',3'-cyclic phosphodiesterase [Acetobacteraceae bacterium H6797]|nr:RNA 2',3'-cyclic phosphodiesterase [Acetobacteraceae bacterium H6797]
MHRLFVALSLPPEIRDQLSGLVTGIPGAKWVPPVNYHMTLRFIGEIEGWRADEVDEALSGIKAKGFELSLRGLGLFEKGGRIQAMWVGADKNDALIHLQNKVETAIQRAGLPPAKKRFAPHVTIARTDRAPTEKLVSFVQAHNLFRADPVPVESFTLFSSRLGKENSVYTPEVDYALA